MQTALGQGVIREIRNHQRLLVDVGGRAVVFESHAVTALGSRAAGHRRIRVVEPAAVIPPVASTRFVRDVDLHGLTVDEALARAESVINDGLLADLSELRFIHGRSGGRIRAALHRRLSAISAVRAFRLDPRNPGVTIVSF